MAAMAGIARGVTLSFRQISHFDQLPLPEAREIIYHDLIPYCETKGVFLSEYGNHAGGGSYTDMTTYYTKKATQQLFDVKRIQKAFAQIPEMVKPITTYKFGSYGFKHIVERFQKEYITNGDLIVAMLFRGYIARFGKQTEYLTVNCEFKASLIIDQQALPGRYWESD